MDKKRIKALKQNFVPPIPQHKDKFLQHFSYPKASFKEVILSQISFIRKRTWVLFMISVCVVFIYTRFTNVPEKMVAGVSAILPILSLIVIIEINKSSTYNMEEMELGCKYNLAKIILMRLIILATASFLILIICVLGVMKSDFGLFRNIMYMSVPYLLSSYLNLLIISKYRSKETIYMCATLCGAVSLFVMLASVRYPFIYQNDFTYIWGSLFISLISLFFYRLIKFIKLQEEIQWNLL